MHSPFLDNLSNDERDSLTKRLFEQQQGKCFICQKEIDLELHNESLDIDHIVPLASNGKDNEMNFALTHKSCNCSKGASNLNVARAIYKIRDLQNEFKTKYSEHPENYSPTHTNANLGDLLEKLNGSKYSLKYKIEGDIFKYSLAELNDNKIYELPVFTDKLSGVKSVFIELPVEYCYHDDFINPRSINSSVEKLIKEFYEKRPQLQISLARINDDENKVYIFDGQHKSAAQIALGAERLFMRLFIDYDKNELLMTNQRAGKELKQIEFDKNILIQLNSRVYQDMVEKYQNAHNLKSDEFKFSEVDLLNYFANDSKLKACIIDNQRNLVAKNADNKLLQFIDFDGRGKNLPISYDAYNSTFLSFFIDTKRFVSETLENENNPRFIELRQLTRLQNIIADNMYIGKFDSSMETAQIESKIANGKGNNISDAHLACFRYSKKEVMYCWLTVLKDIVNYYFTIIGKRKDEMVKNYFKIEFDEQLWEHIANYVKMIAGLPLWIDRNLAETIFATKQNLEFWKSVFETGKSPNGQQVLAVPITYITALNK